MSRWTPDNLRELKQCGHKIAALTAYDYFTAQLLDEAGVPLILVGDSLGQVVLGYENTLPVTMADMLHHVRAVARAKPRGVVVADMPYRTYETDEQALAHARQFREAGADAVKVEGGEGVLPQVRALVADGIPVLGHIGLTPQSIQELGGYKVQGRTAPSIEQLHRDAKVLDDAGVFAMVLECVVATVAGEITAAISVPTIGIGSGVECDGQILVSHDLLGLGHKLPKHARRYADLGAAMRQAFANYLSEVESGDFPGPENSFQ